MQTAGAAEAGQQKLLRIVTAVYRNQSYGFRHVLIGDADYAQCSLFDAQAYLTGQSGNGFHCQNFFQLQSIGQSAAGQQSAQHDIGISDSGMLAATTIASRPWLGTRRLRTNLQHATFVDAGN